MFSFVRSLSLSLTPGSLHIYRVHRHAEQMESVFTLEWFIGVLNMYTNKLAWGMTPNKNKPNKKPIHPILHHYMQETPSPLCSVHGKSI